MARRPAKPPITLAEQLALLPMLLIVLGNAILAAFTGFLVDKQKRPASYLKHVAYTAMRTAFAGLTSRQEQWAFPSTDEAYAQYCKLKKVSPQSETLLDGTKAHWIGDKGAKNVLLYFHGGGYNASGNLEHFVMLHDILQAHNKSASPEHKLAVLLLSYDTAPYAQYPRQLAQGVALLTYTVTKLYYAPANILLGGDSAGGNLTLGVLGHLLHPHPDEAVVSRLELPGKLKAAVLISPWVTFGTSADAFRRNKYKDGIPIAALHRWSSLYMGDAKVDPYNQPLHSPDGWWSGLSNIVKDVFVCGGADEILIDDIVAMGKKIEKEWDGGREDGSVTLELVEDEAHDSILVDRLIGYKNPPPKMDVVVRKWLSEKV